MTFDKRLYVPADGYFARYVEILENTSDVPVTVSFERYGIAVRTGNGAYDQRITDTSDGDAALTAADRWVRTSGPYSSYVSVFAGEGGAAPTEVTASVYTSIAWQNLALAPGQKMAFLFLENAGGTPDVATRLAQLPPEALTGLTADERAAIVNFVVPEQSALAPFPKIHGSVTAGSSVPVPGAQVTVTASNPFLKSPRTTTTDATGAYSMSYPVVDAYSMDAFHPDTSRSATPVTGTLPPGQTEIVADLALETPQVAPLRGRVISEGTGVAGVAGTLTRYSPSWLLSSTSTDAAGAYKFTPLVPGYYAISTAGAPGPIPEVGFWLENDGDVITRDLYVQSRTGRLIVDVFGFDGSLRLRDASVTVTDIDNGDALLGVGYQAGDDDVGQYVFDPISHSSGGMRVVARTASGDATVETVASFPAVGAGQTMTVLPESGDQSVLSRAVAAPPIAVVATMPSCINASAHFSPSTSTTVSAFATAGRW